MSEKQLEKLLDGFAKSSQSLTLLQEGILSLHSVMEQFHKTAEEFSIKNEIETLLPKVNEHFSQAQDVYSNITHNLAKIQEHTEEIEVRGELYSSQVTQTFAELKNIRTYLEQYTEEMAPAYQALQVEVEQLKNMQHGMVDVSHDISGSIAEMNLMQQELKLEMREYREMMTETQEMQKELLNIGQKNLAMNAFVEKMKATDLVATEYFTNICGKWQEEHLDAAIEKWAEENLEEAILKKIKGALGLRWK